MHRESDPEARRLLAEIERLEAEPWPEAFDAYAAALLALGQRCEQPAGMAEVYRWAARGLQPLLHSGSRARRSWRVDALADVTARLAGFLWRCRAGLDPCQPPNLLSVLGAAVKWRANDIAESTHGRHARRQGEASRPMGAAGSAFSVVYAHEVCALIGVSDAPARALLLIGRGASIAEAARRTGASRQQIYRARERLRADCEWVGSDER